MHLGTERPYSMERSRRLLIRLLALFALGGVATPLPALAAGSPATETVVTTRFTKSIALSDTPPCVGTVTYDVHDVFHITEFDNGVMHVSNNQSGDVTFASAVDGQLYTGRFTGTFDLQANQRTFTNGGTYHLRVEAPDGSKIRFWITSHQTFTRFSDEPVADFFKIRCAQE